MVKKDRCVNCGCDDVDWRIDDKGNMIWNCFECEHEWITNLRGLEDED